MIELEAGHVSLLDAQRRHGLEPERLDPERRGRREHVLPQRDTVIRRHIDLVGQLARETEADQTHRYGVELGFQTPHVGKPRIRDIRPRQRQLECGARLRTGNRHGRPLIT